MNPLVSIIIPCYNAGQYLTETLDCCLAQTYPNVEIIVVDDCSTDASPAILADYSRRNADQMRWVQQPQNRGGNAARNRGLALAQGEYVQWLDADDLILPRKIERQVQFLQQTGLDVVYGDWQAQYHYEDGRTRLTRVLVPGQPTDVLEALLADWWTAVASLLYRRTAIERIGWNERLLNADDRYYMLTLAMAGARFGYQPGCASIYRRYAGSVSASSPLRWVRSHMDVLAYVTENLINTNRLMPAYRRAIATSYWKLSRHVLRLQPTLSRELLQKALAIDPHYVALNEPVLYKAVQKVMGFQRTEQLASVYRLLRRRKWQADEW